MKRLKVSNKIVLSEWVQIDVGGYNTIQIITDAMAQNSLIQIEYTGSGWRTIQPYGWYTSKAGNLLLMCYKDTDEIRSYRFDRILQILVDDSLVN